MKNKRMDKRGEMGIGTLIIFIAMVLVAAVAATVLITTADELQMQAYSTGRTARQDVSTGLNVVHVYGDLYSPEPTDGAAAGNQDRIQNLTIKVKLQAGSDPIDLNQMIVQISDGNKMVDYSYHGSADADLVFHYNASLELDPAEHAVFTADDILTEGSLVALTFDCADWLSMDGHPEGGGVGNTNAPGPDFNLTTQQEVTCKLIPKHGVPTLVKFTSPSTYADERYVEIL